MNPKFPNFTHVKLLLTNPSDTFLDLIGQSSLRAEARADVMTVIKFAKFSMVLLSRLTSAGSTAYDLLPPRLFSSKSCPGLRFRSLLAHLLFLVVILPCMSAPSHTVSVLYRRIACGHCTLVSANSCAPCSGLPGSYISTGWSKFS
jgi:hypothetical protein